MGHPFNLFIYFQDESLKVQTRQLKKQIFFLKRPSALQSTHKLLKLAKLPPEPTSFSGPSGGPPRWPRCAWPRCSRWTASSSRPCSPTNHRRWRCSPRGLRSPESEKNNRRKSGGKNFANVQNMGRGVFYTTLPDEKRTTKCTNSW